MPRSMWTGAISFGLVTVPVKLYSAVQRKTVRFNQLNAKTGARIAQKRVDSGTGEEVPYEDIVKGYEISSDRYVVIEPDELEALDPKATRTIDILDFVEQAEIDPIFYDHPYYLAPAAGGAKPYRLLLEAMRETGRVAIARVVIRSKQSLVALRPAGDVLEMSTMLFADEVVDPKRIEDVPAADDVETNERELAIAKQLVESLATEWEPGKYRDDYRDRVLELIEAKAAGDEIAVQPEAEEPQAVPDLMSALKASLDAVRSSGSGAKPKPTPSEAKSRGPVKDRPAPSKAAPAKSKAKPKAAPAKAKAPARKRAPAASKK